MVKRKMFNSNNYYPLKKVMHLEYLWDSLSFLLFQERNFLIFNLFFGFSAKWFLNAMLKQKYAKIMEFHLFHLLFFKTQSALSSIICRQFWSRKWIEHLRFEMISFSYFIMNKVYHRWNQKSAVEGNVHDILCIVWILNKNGKNRCP